MIHTFTKSNFDKEVLTSSEPVLVDFWASWCGPCRMLSPIVEAIAKDNPALKVGKVNVDEQPELAEKYRVFSIPTLIYFKNGQPAGTSVGVRSQRDIESMLK